MKYLIAALLLIASCVTAAAQGCGPSNPNCIVPTAPVGTSNNQAASTAFVQNQISGSNLVSGPNSSVVGDVALFNNITGNLIKDAGGGAPNVPQPHPASGNLLCPSGFNGTAASPNHVLTWVDQAQCWTNDVQLWVSFDPSALLTVALSGTPNTGDVETITFHYGATTATIQYTTKVSDTATIVASCLTDATISGCPGAGNVGIKQAGVSLYNNVAGAQGQIFYFTTTGATIDIDWNSAVSMYLSNSSTGNRISFAYSGTNGSNTCSSGTPCIAGLDNNPVQEIERCAASGTSPPCVVPAAGSVIWAQQFIGASSTGNLDTTYGQIVMAVANSATGSILGRMEFINKNHSGNDGLYITNGLCTIGYSCMGIDTLDTGQFWTAGTEEIDLSGSVWQFLSGTSHSININGQAGVSITMGTPTAPSSDTLEVFSPVSAGTNGQFPASGSFWTLSGGANPISYCFNWTSSAYLPCVFLGSSFDLKPSNGTGGWTISANSMTPDADNATSLGSGANRIARTVTQNLRVNQTGALKGNGTAADVTQAACADLSNAGTTCPTNANTGLTISGTNLNSNAQVIEKFSPGQLAAVVNTKGSFTKWTKAATVDNLEGSATSFTCSGNPTITFYECGTSTTCASSPTTIGTVTVTAAGTVVDGTVSNPAITAGDYTAWAVSAGTCTALDIVGSANIHSN